MSGREFRHSISTELSPGEYTLLFVLEMPTGAAMGCSHGKKHGTSWDIMGDFVAIVQDVEALEFERNLSFLLKAEVSDS